MITAQDVAEYFLAKASRFNNESDISNMKLQKLIYYAQAFHLAIFDKPLFEEDFEAWTHGPVCPQVYHYYKRYGSSPIPCSNKFIANKFTRKQIELLNEVFEVFGQFSAWKLRNISHQETPWMAKEATAGVISKASMKVFYKTRLQ